jgi:hypothetical protein
MTKKPKHGTLNIGPLSEKGKGYGSSHHKPAPVVLDIPDRITNASVPKGSRYSAKQDLSYRGMDVRHPSRGVG